MRATAPEIEFFGNRWSLLAQNLVKRLTTMSSYFIILLEVFLFLREKLATAGRNYMACVIHRIRRTRDLWF